MEDATEKCQPYLLGGGGIKKERVPRDTVGGRLETSRHFILISKSFPDVIFATSAFNFFDLKSFLTSMINDHKSSMVFNDLHGILWNITGILLEYFWSITGILHGILLINLGL